MADDPTAHPDQLQAALMAAAQAHITQAHIPQAHAGQAHAGPTQAPPMRAPWGDIAPRLTQITDDVLFGEVWRQPGLSPRDRSLITVAALIALYRENELPFHVSKALENGVTRDEIIEAITHLAFYSGWPTASTALAVARRVFDETPAR